MSLSLTENSYPIVNIMPDKESREKYMEVLLESQKEKEPTKFEDLVGDYTKRTLEKRIKILQLNEENKRDAEEDTNLKK
nr:hypothetical protein [uncultured Lactobacillus sp.]